MISRKEQPLLLVVGSKVLAFQLSQGPYHPRDEGFVLALLCIVDLGLPHILNCERHGMVFVNKAGPRPELRNALDTARGRAILWQRCNLARLSVTLPNLGFAQVT